MSLQSFLDKLAAMAEANDSGTVEAKADVYVPSERSQELRPDPFHHSDGVWDAYKESNGKLIDRIFAQLGPAAKEDKKYISEHFANGKPGEYTARSPVLNHKLASASLMQRVEKLVGRK